MNRTIASTIARSTIACSLLLAASSACTSDSPVQSAGEALAIAPGVCAASITEPAAANALLASCAPSPVVPSDNSCGFNYSYSTGRLTGWKVAFPPYVPGTPEPLPPGVGKSLTVECMAACSQQAYNNDGTFVPPNSTSAPFYSFPKVNGDDGAYCNAVAADPGSRQAITAQLNAKTASQTALLDTGVSVTLTVKDLSSSDINTWFDPADIAAQCDAQAGAAAKKLCDGQTVQVTSCITVQGGACNTGALQLMPVQGVDVWN